MYANLAKIFPGDLLQNLETPGLSGRVDRYDICVYIYIYISSTWWLFMNYTRKQSKFYTHFDILSGKMEILN